MAEFAYTLKDAGPGGQGLAGLMLGMQAPVRPMKADGRRMTVRALLTSEAKRDRQGDVVSVAGMDTSSHELNPVCLWDHGRAYPLPIAVDRTPEGVYTVESDPEAGEMWHTAHFSQRSLMAEQVFALIEEGMLAGCSAGFRPIEWEALPPDPEQGFRATANGPAGKLILRSELVECSFASVPVNGEAARAIVGKSWCSRPLAPVLLDSMRPFLPDRRSLPVRGGWDAAGMAAKAWEWAGKAGPPGPPPRPGLVWREETRRWAREGGGKEEAAPASGPGSPDAPEARPAPPPPPARSAAAGALAPLSDALPALQAALKEVPAGEEAWEAAASALRDIGDHADRLEEAALALAEEQGLDPAEAWERARAGDLAAAAVLAANGLREAERSASAVEALYLSWREAGGAGEAAEEAAEEAFAMMEGASLALEQAEQALQALEAEAAALEDDDALAEPERLLAESGEDEPSGEKAWSWAAKAGPPGPPPRPGLQWKEETRRWVSPDGGGGGGADAPGADTGLSEDDALAELERLLAEDAPAEAGAEDVPEDSEEDEDAEDDAPSGPDEELTERFITPEIRDWEEQGGLNDAVLDKIREAIRADKGGLGSDRFFYEPCINPETGRLEIWHDDAIEAEFGGRAFARESPLTGQVVMMTDDERAEEAERMELSDEADPELSEHYGAAVTQLFNRGQLTQEEIAAWARELAGDYEGVRLALNPDNRRVEVWSDEDADEYWGEGTVLQLTPDGRLDMDGPPEEPEPSGSKAWSWADAGERRAAALARKSWSWCSEKARTARQEGEVWTVGNNRYTKVGGKIRRAPLGGKDSPKRTEAEHAEWKRGQEERHQGPKRPKGDPAKAREAVLAHIAKGDAATADDIHALASTLRGLTVAEIKAIKAEHGVKASGVKWDLAAKVADRLVAAVRAKAPKEQPKEAPKPAKEAAPADAASRPDVQAAFGDAYRRLHDATARLGGIVKIPELADEMKAAVPGLTTEEIHAALQQWMKEDKLTLQVANDPHLEERAGEGFHLPYGDGIGTHGLRFYVQARDEQASAFPPAEAPKPPQAGKPAPGKPADLSKPSPEGRVIPGGPPKPPEPGFTGTDRLGREWQNGELVARRDDEPEAKPAKADAPAGKAKPFGDPAKLTGERAFDIIEGIRDEGRRKAMAEAMIAARPDMAEEIGRYLEIAAENQPAAAPAKAPPAKAAPAAAKPAPPAASAGKVLHDEDGLRVVEKPGPDGIPVPETAIDEPRGIALAKEHADAMAEAANTIRLYKGGSGTVPLLARDLRQEVQRRTGRAMTLGEAFDAIHALNQAGVIELHKLNEVQSIPEAQRLSAGIHKDDRFYHYTMGPDKDVTGDDVRRAVEALEAKRAKQKPAAPERSGPPGPPPRPGLEWDDQAKRWVSSKDDEHAEAKPAEAAPKAKAPAFPSDKAARKMLDVSALPEAARQAALSLPAGLKEAVRRYTVDEDNEAGEKPVYQELNRALREGKEPPADARAVHEGLLRAFAATPPLAEPVMVWRGVRGGADVLRQAQEALSSGGPLVLAGHQSASRRPAMAVSGFGPAGPGNEGAVLLEIAARHGIDADEIGAAQNEKEFILPHGSRFRVAGIKEVPFVQAGKKTMRQVVQLEQLPEEAAGGKGSGTAKPAAPAPSAPAPAAPPSANDVLARLKAGKIDKGEAARLLAAIKAAKAPAGPQEGGGAKGDAPAPAAPGGPAKPPEGPPKAPAGGSADDADPVRRHLPALRSRIEQSGGITTDAIAESAGISRDEADAVAGALLDEGMIRRRIAWVPGDFVAVPPEEREFHARYRAGRKADAAKKAREAEEAEAEAARKAEERKTLPRSSAGDGDTAGPGGEPAYYSKRDGVRYAIQRDRRTVEVHGRGADMLAGDLEAAGFRKDRKSGKWIGQLGRLHDVDPVAHETLAYGTDSH